MRNARGLLLSPHSIRFVGVRRKLIKGQCGQSLTARWVARDYLVARARPGGSVFVDAVGLALTTIFFKEHIQPVDSIDHSSCGRDDGRA
jgi:hypothetical protein